MSVKKQRVEQLLQAGEQEKQKFIDGFIGETVTIVPERCINGYTEGYSGNYIRVYVDGEHLGRMVRARVTKLYKDGVKAKVIQ